MKFLFLPLFFFLLVNVYAQQLPGPAIPAPSDFEGIDLDTVRAREEFRLGVQAYNRFLFSEAIHSFERALSFRPGEPLILDWLGRAYFNSGIENTAFRAWEAAIEGFGRNSGQGILIFERLQTLRNRRSLLPVPDDNVRYVESGRFPGRTGNIIHYRQPTSILAQDDGSVWVVAYGSNELVRIDPNGIIRERRRGPMVGFDRPFDIVRGPDGLLFVSEFRGNRVSVLSPAGEWLFHIGSRGQGPGQFIGPQNLAVDEQGFLYVVDFGNRRISKFDPSGAFILSFGSRGSGFPGFISPTGIAVTGGRVFVADSLLRQIFMFDLNGSFLGTLLASPLTSPESLRVLSDGKLLAVDSNRILLIDPNTAIVRELGTVRNPANVRITGAEMDANGNVLLADFQSGEVVIMTRIDDMAAGLFVEIRRVAADNFPLVTVEIEVTDRLRRPIVGLDARNFLLSEGGLPVNEQTFLSAAHRSHTSDVSILIERSPATFQLRDNLVTAVRDISSAVDRVVSIVSAGEQPVRENLDTAAGNTPAQRLASAARGNPAHYSSQWRFDRALRLAATDLLPAGNRRAVIYVGSGSLGDSRIAFEQHSISELAAYLSNNNVVFYAVIVGGGMPGADIRYLTWRTGGQYLALFREQGIMPELHRLRYRPTGIYYLSYRSRLPTDFGRAFLPIEAEVYLLERSGRDSTGFFAPLD